MDSSTGRRRREVVELFRTSRGPLTAREVADELGLHINTARFHLDALVRQGRLRRLDGRSDGPGRPRTPYSLVPGMDRGGPRSYMMLAEMLLTHLATSDDPVGSATAAGAAWGRYLVEPVSPGQRITADDAMIRLVDLLNDVGFQPRTHTDDDRRIDLRHCPFLELAETYRDLVCGLHLGLVRGALERLDTPLHTERLIPFADPQTCVTQLAG